MNKAAVPLPETPWVPERKVLMGLSLLWVLAIGPAYAQSPSFPTGQLTENATLEWGGQMRTYDVYVPTTYDPSNPLPLVVDIHGFGSFKEQQRSISFYLQLAESEGFVAAWPNGSGVPRGWNAGNCCGAPIGFFQTDDVGFILEMVWTLKGELAIDPARIYASGLSNGGAMSHRLACDAAHVFAAVAPIAFPLPYTTFSDCQPSRPIPVTMVMGLTDVIIAYEPLIFAGAQESFMAWRDKNRCEGTLPDQVTPLTQPALCETYTTCEGGVETQLCSVVGFPFYGDLAPFYGHILYFNSSGYNVSPESWAFMKRFSNPHPGDFDDDGTPDEEDLFPRDPSEAFDHDRDGTGDNADLDDDNDFWADSEEAACQTDALDRESVPDDSDRDGICNFKEARWLSEKQCTRLKNRANRRDLACRFRAVAAASQNSQEPDLSSCDKRMQVLYTRAETKSERCATPGDADLRIQQNQTFVTARWQALGANSDPENNELDSPAAKRCSVRRAQAIAKHYACEQRASQLESQGAQRERLVARRIRGRCDRELGKNLGRIRRRHRDVCPAADTTQALIAANREAVAQRRSGEAAPPTP